MDIEKRQADRLRVMRAIFDAANGSEAEVVRLAAQVQESLRLSDHELLDACNYLVGERLITAPIKTDDVIVGVQITHRGIKEMEESVRTPSKPTEHFPSALSIVNVHGSVIGSAIQSGSPGAQQEVSVGNLNLDAVREFLREYDAQAANLELPTPAAEELNAEIDTIKAQLRSPNPKRRRSQAVEAIQAGGVTVS